MNKVHGPALKRERIELCGCRLCRGKGFTKPLFYELECVGCGGSGWVAAVTGEALPVEVLVVELGLRLRLVQQQLVSLQHRGSGPQAAYEQNNRRGAGGSNFTGD